MSQFSNKLKKTYYWPFPPFLGQKTFSWKIQLSHTTSYEFLALCPNLEKVNNTIQRKRPRQINRRTNRPYFKGPFWLSLGLQKGSYTLVCCQMTISTKYYGGELNCALNSEGIIALLRKNMYYSSPGLIIIDSDSVLVSKNKLKYPILSYCGKQDLKVTSATK